MRISHYIFFVWFVASHIHGETIYELCQEISSEKQNFKVEVPSGETIPIQGINLPLRFDQAKVLGFGQQGQVKIVEKLKQIQGIDVVVKSMGIKLTDENDKSVHQDIVLKAQQIVYEILIAKAMGTQKYSPWFFGCVRDSFSVYLIMEKWGDNWAKPEAQEFFRSLTPYDRLKHLEDLINATSYLWNDLKVRHSDIKPDNILFNQDKSRSGYIDFGLVQSAKEVQAHLHGAPYFKNKQVFEGGDLKAESDLHAVLLSFVITLSSQDSVFYYGNDELAQDIQIGRSCFIGGNLGNCMPHVIKHVKQVLDNGGHGPAVPLDDAKVTDFADGKIGFINFSSLVAYFLEKWENPDGLFDRFVKAFARIIKDLEIRFDDMHCDKLLEGFEFEFTHKKAKEFLEGLDGRGCEGRSAKRFSHASTLVNQFREQFTRTTWQTVIVRKWKEAPKIEQPPKSHKVQLPLIESLYVTELQHPGAKDTQNPIPQNLFDFNSRVVESKLLHASDKRRDSLNSMENSLVRSELMTGLTQENQIPTRLKEIADSLVESAYLTGNQNKHLTDDDLRALAGLNNNELNLIKSELFMRSERTDNSFVAMRRNTIHESLGLSQLGVQFTESIPYSQKKPKAGQETWEHLRI